MGGTRVVLNVRDGEKQINGLMVWGSRSVWIMKIPIDLEQKTPQIFWDSATFRSTLNWLFLNKWMNEWQGSVSLAANSYL